MLTENEILEILKDNRTSNFVLIKRKSEYKLYFDCQYEQLTKNSPDVELVDINQEIFVDVVEVDNFPSLC